MHAVGYADCQASMSIRAYLRNYAARSDVDMAEVNPGAVENGKK